MSDTLFANEEYPTAAFHFVQDGLAHTVRLVHGDDAPHGDESRHVNGRELCMGLRDYALERYGRLARTVLDHWGVRRTDDFGRIVFAMIDAGVMRKSDQDDLDDFSAIYDFEEAFEN